jgi:hypothetical protein
MSWFLICVMLNDVRVPHSAAEGLGCGGLLTADVFCIELGIMVCDLEVYRVRVGTWAAKTGGRVQGRNKDAQVSSFLVNACLCAAVLAVLAVLLILAEWRKILDLAWKVRAFCKLCAVGVTGV